MSELENKISEMKDQTKIMNTKVAEHTKNFRVVDANVKRIEGSQNEVKLKIEKTERNFDRKVDIDYFDDELQSLSSAIVSSQGVGLQDPSIRIVRK